MNFTDALVELKKGKRLSRKGWIGIKYVELVNGENPCIMATYADRSCIPWMIGQYDIFCNDWYIKT